MKQACPSAIDVLKFNTPIQSDPECVKVGASTTATSATGKGENENRLQPKMWASLATLDHNGGARLQELADTGWGKCVQPP